MTRRLIATFALIFSVPTGCAPEAPSTQGTRTNWLLACDSDAQCGTELSCACGICTLPCDSDAECGGDVDGICGADLALSTQCAGEATPEPICLPVPESGCTEWSLEGDDEVGVADVSECNVVEPLVCQSFDAPLPEWTAISVGDRVDLQDCEVARGAGALRFDGEHTQVRIPFDSGVEDGSLHLRAFVRLSSDLTFDSEFMTIFTIWSAADAEQVSSTVKLTALPDGALQVFADSNAPDTLTFNGSPGDIPRDEWVCIEWAMNVDDAAGSATVSVDGTPVIDITDIDTRAMDPYDRINVTNFTGITAGSLYVDDLVVARSPIGCD